MKKIKFIYNPYSGENAILSDLDKVIMLNQKYNFITVPYRISKDCSIENAFCDIDDTYEYILVAGGDGTVDSVVNAMKKLDIDLPIAILPVGTANDFAKYIGMPQEVETAITQILEGDVKGIDLGKINDKYFINVASTGLFTDISQKTDTNMKNAIGKLAYYVKGIEQLPNFKSLKVNVSSEEFSYDGDMYLLLVFNGQTAGNLRIAYKAAADDGMLDVIIIKAIMVKDMFPLLIKLIRGDHLEDCERCGLIYFKTGKLKIECNEDIVTDIDGERGPDFPLNIECIKNGIKIRGIKL